MITLELMFVKLEAIDGATTTSNVQQMWKISFVRLMRMATFAALQVGMNSFS